MQAGLFSAVTSAFIIEIDSQLQPDPNRETAALLRVLIHKIDNTTFGGETPPVPHQSSPTHAIIHVQALLYASLAVSLFSAFLAMLGKQWLNQYASTVHGTAIERSQSRQQKCDGIVTWYFQHVMESLPLMPQAALLLHGCALSLYLCGINTTIASLAIGATSAGALIYFSIVVAGATSKTCPYQTPGASALRLLAPAIMSIAPAVASTFRYAAEQSKTVHMLREGVQQSTQNVVVSLWRLLCKLFGALADDTFCLGQTIVHLLVVPTHWVYTQLVSAPSTQENGSNQQLTLDLRCISWILKTSLDKTVHLSTLNFLATSAALGDFDPVLVADCFNVLTDCVAVIDGTVVVTQGLEQLATVSAMCLFRTLSYISVRNPHSSILGSVCQGYRNFFEHNTNFEGFTFCHTLGAIHGIFYPEYIHRWLVWWDYKPSSSEHVIFGHALALLAQSEYQRREHDKRVPAWILRFALRFLSSTPLPPPTIVINCLAIIAIDLGCDVLDAGTGIPDEGYVHISHCKCQCH